MNEASFMFIWFVYGPTFGGHCPVVQPTFKIKTLSPVSVPQKGHPIVINFPCSTIGLKNKAENIVGCHNEVNAKIQQAFKLITLRIDCCLIQFWSTCSVGKNELLKTADQPFSFGTYNRALCNYRKESERKCFHVDEKYEEVQDLVPVVRVYKHGMPEWTSDVTNCYSKNQPLQVCAIRLNLHGYLVLPVFDSSTKSCVGVLEFITTSIYLDCAYEVQQIHRALKAANLTSPQAFDTPTSYVDYKQHELDEIFNILKDVCSAHKLPLAQTWTVSPRTSFVATGRTISRTCNSFNSSCIEKVCMSTTALPFHVDDLSLWPFREVCKEHHLLKSHGVVGRALSSQGSCFCADVTKLDDVEYTLVHNARMSGLTSSFAIYLHSIEHDDSYVLEFFLPVDMKEGADLHNLVQKVKMHLKFSSFEFGDLSSTEVIGMQTEVSQRSSEMQVDSKDSLTVGETNVNINSINAQYQSDFSNDDQQTLIKVYANDVTSYKCDVVIKQRRKHRRNSVTREAIQQKFGKPIEEASKALGGVHGQPIGVPYCIGPITIIVEAWKVNHVNCRQGAQSPDIYKPRPKAIVGR
nr:hypothetical protein [Tanacetum cinerariifolium]